AALEEWRLGGKPPDAAVLCVVHPMDDLRLSAFHRLVAGPVARDHLIELLTPAFEVRPVTGPPAPAPGSFGLYAGGGWLGLRYRAARGEGPAGLDVTVLEQTLAGSAYPLGVVPTRRSVEELVGLCDADGGALFTLAPPPLEVLTSLADAGEVMPPKTT